MSRRGMYTEVWGTYHFSMCTRSGRCCGELTGFVATGAGGEREHAAQVAVAGASSSWTLRGCRPMTIASWCGTKAAYPLWC